MRVIGTAGHVDHGKSSLVQRLTGINPDRLIEEQKRKLTIDLGFAWLTLGDDETIGIVDVPGHRDFIENMLAGIGGIDAVLLVIAADEGVMPQTREHLAILDLLGIPTGMIVLSKIDLIDDPDWLDLVELEIHEVVDHTILANAPIVRVSAHSGEGLDQLRATLSNLLTTIETRVNYKQPRLPIDRIFTVEGFGTVVTGTLSGGTLSIGDTIEVQPKASQGRVRGLQSYKQEIAVALPGSRVAVNITGVDRDAVERGDVLAYPGQLHATQLIDVHFHHLADAPRPLQHNAEVKFFSGASETLARVRLLGHETLAAGESGWLQLRLHNPIPLTLRDRFILRYPSPAQTIGGGVIVNPQPAKRWRRFQQDVLDDLQMRLDGTPAERVTQAAISDQPLKLVHLQKATGMGDHELQGAIAAAIEKGLVTRFENEQFLATQTVQSYIQQIEALVHGYHLANPLRLGMPREEVRSQLGIKLAFLNLLLGYAEHLVIEGQYLRSPSHEIRFSAQQVQAIERLMQAMDNNPYSPPSFSEGSEITGGDVLFALIDLGEIVQVQPEVIFTTGTYEHMVREILTLMDTHTSIDTGQVRDHFGTSRKYAIGLLEYLDSIGITRREGDVRVRGKNAAHPAP